MESKQIEEKQTWHKPQVERLIVNLDTGYTSGSYTDGGGSGSLSSCFRRC